MPEPMIVVSEFVTDGVNTWLETQKFIFYSKREAKRLFRQHIRDKGWTIVK